MNDYQRMTQKVDYPMNECNYDWHCLGCPFEKRKIKNCDEYCFTGLLQKLGELEDKIEDGTLVEWKYKKECLEELNKLNTQLFEISLKMEQGLLVELPCKVGDTIYHVVDRCMFINSCDEYDQHICGRPYCNAFIRKEKFTINMLNRIGKDIFLIDMETEAQTKLAELRGEK